MYSLSENTVMVMLLTTIKTYSLCDYMVYDMRFTST